MPRCLWRIKSIPNWNFWRFNSTLNSESGLRSKIAFSFRNCVVTKSRIYRKISEMTNKWNKIDVIARQMDFIRFFFPSAARIQNHINPSNENKFAFHFDPMWLFRFIASHKYVWDTEIHIPKGNLKHQDPFHVYGWYDQNPNPNTTWKT